MTGIGIGIGFVGVRTSRFDETRAFYRDVFGLTMTKDEPGVAWFETPAGVEVHVYGPTDDGHDFFGVGPVVGFLVDDFDVARQRLVDAGITFIGEPQRSADATWNHYHGPDGNVYEIMERHRAAAVDP